MRLKKTINVGNLILSLSDALDLASPELLQHQQKVAFIVWEMGQAGQFSSSRMERLFVTGLLHDIGALTLEEKIALVKSKFEATAQHCLRGEFFLKNIPWFKDTAEIVRFHHTEWRSWKESIEKPLVFDSQVVFLADSVERLIQRGKYILHQDREVTAAIKSQAGTLFHPSVVDLFLAASGREEFWLDLASVRLYSMLLNKGPFRKTKIQFHELYQISEMFRNIIDFRSHFTATHSSGVAVSARLLARKLGLTDSEVDLMEIAGNLHDLGKLVVPNDILEKPGKLTEREMAVMKSHTYYTYYIINTIRGLENVAEWAAFHHERLDGSGYPFRCTAEELNIGACILMVADIFTALSEDRPYRPAMQKAEIVKIIQGLADKHLLERNITDLLFDEYDDIFLRTREKQAAAKKFYEDQPALSPDSLLPKPRR